MFQRLFLACNAVCRDVVRTRQLAVFHGNLLQFLVFFFGGLFVSLGFPLFGDSAFHAPCALVVVVSRDDGFLSRGRPQGQKHVRHVVGKGENGESTLVRSGIAEGKTAFRCIGRVDRDQYVAFEPGQDQSGTVLQCGDISFDEKHVFRCAAAGCQNRRNQNRCFFHGRMRVYAQDSDFS